MIKFTDDDGNEFFSVNIAVGNDDETFIDGAPILPPGVLNDFLKTK